MKKYKIIIASLMFFSWISTACAVPFEVGTNSTLSVGGLGVGLYSYTANAAGPYDLVDGESTTTLTFFNVTFSAIAAGQISATIDLVSPTGDVSLDDNGNFLAVGTINPLFSLGYVDVTWNDPIQIGYSYQGNSGGILELDLFDIHQGFLAAGAQTIAIQGVLTNITSPVPEPTTMLLFGTGIAGLALVGRKRRL